MQREPHSRWARGRDRRLSWKEIAAAKWYARLPPQPPATAHRRQVQPQAARAQPSAQATSSGLAQSQRSGEGSRFDR
eukprot:3128148-Pleurochrysis_carterae.AAC.1